MNTPKLGSRVFRDVKLNSALTDLPFGSPKAPDDDEGFAPDWLVCMTSAPVPALSVQQRSDNSKCRAKGISSFTNC